MFLLGLLLGACICIALQQLYTDYKRLTKSTRAPTSYHNTRIYIYKLESRRITYIIIIL